MNYVIANITDEIIKQGETYPIVEISESIVHIGVNGKIVGFDIHSNDIAVCLNGNEPMDFGTLADWYINSVSSDDKPVWTEKHIEELLNDFYVIPKSSEV